MSDFKDLEFLAERAKELLDRQISSYRTNYTKAATIIGISSVFIPVFLFFIEKSQKVIQFISLLPILIFLISIVLLILVLMSQQLYQGFNQKQFDNLVNQDYESILLYEIGAKKDSISDNEAIVEKQNKLYNKGLIATIIAILLSILLLITSVLINNNSTMTKTTTTTQTSKEVKPEVFKTKARVIPQVPQKERMPLNEGYEHKIDSTKKK
ncbi:MAG: hypothetical protein WCJ61_14375 [Paludibacter sp.]